jgi:hypothetical protein
MWHLQGHCRCERHITLVFDDACKGCEEGFRALRPGFADGFTQEWLWCETWCGNATKRYAKTIDLCNNPLTKEPKLDSARRIVAEWPALDVEVAAFTAQARAASMEWHLHRDDSPVCEGLWATGTCSCRMAGCTAHMRCY